MLSNILWKPWYFFFRNLWWIKSTKEQKFILFWSLNSSVYTVLDRKVTEFTCNMYTRIKYDTHKISNDFLNAFLSSVNTISGSFESDIVTVCARAREANSYTAIFLRQLSQHLASPTDEVTVMPGVHDHTVLYHVILKRKDRWTAGSTVVHSKKH